MTLMQTKLSLSNFQPKRNLNDLPEKKEILLGNIVGIANGIKKGFQADGITPYEGLTGNFKIAFIGQKDKDGKTPENIQAGVCYLPDSFMLPILALLAGEVDKDGVFVKDPVSSVEFAYGVYIIDAGNAAKYSWQLKPLLEVAANDPLAKFDSLMGGAAPAQIAAPVEEAKAPAGKSGK